MERRGKRQGSTIWSPQPFSESLPPSLPTSIIPTHSPIDLQEQSGLHHQSKSLRTQPPPTPSTYPSISRSAVTTLMGFSPQQLYVYQYLYQDCNFLSVYQLVFDRLHLQMFVLFCLMELDRIRIGRCKCV